MVGVLDAIDHLLRRRSVVALRLGVCAARVVVVYEVGMWDVVELVALSPGDGRWDECATVLVAMLFNLSVGWRRLRGALVWAVCRHRARWWGHGHRGGLVVQCLFTRELLTLCLCQYPRVCFRRCTDTTSWPCASLSFFPPPAPHRWLVARNIRGWTQLAALQRLGIHISHILPNFFVSAPKESHRRSTPTIETAFLAQSLSTLRV